MGTPTHDASAISVRLPAIAFAIPPPPSPTGLGSRVKNSQFTAPAPCTTT